MPLTIAVPALGVAQIISWGSPYYSIAVLGQDMRLGAGASETVLFGSFALGLMLSGLVAPAIGKWVDARGGRVVLSAGSLLGAAALLLLAAASGPATLVAGWALAGLAMAACLYEPAFMALSRIAGTDYRRAVTIVTLFGGFASTVFWPLSQILLETVGWRQTLAIYAGLHILICLPLHLGLVPKHSAAPQPMRTASAPETAPGGAAYVGLAAAFALSAFVVSVLSVHLIGLLKTAGLSAKDAVALAALIGPMQVAGRIVEFALAHSLRPVAAGALSFGLMLAALVALCFVERWASLAVAFAVFYGWSNGVMTIVRGTVPAELFGRIGYGALLGRLARPAFIAKALAPVIFSAALAAGLARDGALWALVGCAALACLAYGAAVLARGRPGLAGGG